MTETNPTDPNRRRKPAPRRFHSLPSWTGPSTRLIHGGRRADYNAGSVVPPIYQSTTYHYPAPYSESAGRGGVYLYTRNANPTLEVAAELLRNLEGAKAAKVYASGMGAISATLVSLLRPGAEVVALDTLYGGTLDFLRWFGAQYDLRVRWVNTAQSREPERVVRKGTRLVYLESPTNPLLQVHDIARWARAADRFGALVAVDNTFATPINQRPLELGADLVIHSATKYLGGHADLLGGTVIGSPELLDRIDPHETLGSVLDPFAAFLLVRGLKTLAIRVTRQNENGQRAAEALAGHPKVERVFYPGRGSAHQEEIAGRQMSGRGGMIAFVVRGGLAGARKLLRRLRLVHVASSLGGVESLASLPLETSHRHLTSDELSTRGIPPGLVRISLGIEEPDDLVRDLMEALDRL